MQLRVRGPPKKCTHTHGRHAGRAPRSSLSHSQTCAWRSIGAPGTVPTQPPDPHSGTDRPMWDGIRLFFHGRVGGGMSVSPESMGLAVHHSHASCDMEWQLHPWLPWKSRVGASAHAARCWHGIRPSRRVTLHVRCVGRRGLDRIVRRTPVLGGWDRGMRLLLRYRSIC